MSKPLSPQTIAIVKSTATALQQYGVAITTRMYEHLFVDPQIKALFDDAAQKSGEQPRRLAGAILAYAQHIDRLDALVAAVDQMAARHVRARVRPEYYPAVADALLSAIKDVLREAATEEVLNAWGEAYWFLAGVLIQREAQLFAPETA